MELVREFYPDKKRVRWYENVNGLQTIVCMFWSSSGRAHDAEREWLIHLAKLDEEVRVTDPDRELCEAVTLEHYLYDEPPPEFDDVDREAVAWFVCTRLDFDAEGPLDRAEVAYYGENAWEHASWADIFEHLHDWFEGDVDLARQTFDRFQESQP